MHPDSDGREDVRPTRHRGTVGVALFWFLYMSGLGAIFPYLSLYFREDAGLSGDQLGVALAMTPLVGIFSQPFWGHWADRSGRRRGALVALSLGAAAGYLLVWQATSFLPLVACLALTAVFTTPAMAVASSLSFAVLGEGGAARFGRVRAWGTVGYLLMILALPRLLEGREVAETGLALIFPLASALCVLAAAALAVVPPAGAVAIRSRRGDLGALLREAPYLRLLGLAFFAYGLLTGPILLFPVFVSERGGTVETVSQLWIPMLLLEIPLILYAGAGLRRLGARGLISLGIVCDGARWAVCALAPSLWWMFGIQLLHGFVVVGFIIGMQLYVEGAVPARLRATGQTVLGTVISAGAVLSNLWVGFALERFGATTPYVVAGFGGIALGSIAWRILGAGPTPSAVSTPPRAALD
jgi:PPP family 3-phenylpropionic acid transporter